MKTFLSTPTKAHIAGVLLIIISLINYLYFPLIVQIKPFHSIEEVYLWSYCIKPIATLFLALISYVLLLQTKPNKPTRVALYILIGWWMVTTTYYISYYFAEVHETPVLIYAIARCLDVLFCMCSVYTYGLICRNNDMDKRDITWINIYIIANILSAIYYIFNQISGFGHYYTVIQTFFDNYVLWYQTGSYKIFLYSLMVLILIAHWRFAHCAAFTGTDEQKTPLQENYKPIGRYVVAVLVTLALGAGISFLLLHFADPILQAIG